MFEDCTSLVSLDLSRMSTRSAVNMDGMFNRCESLADVRLGNQFSFKGSGSTVLTTLPSESVNGHTDWFSSTAQAWMSADDIASGQNNVYARYAKQTVPFEADPNPGTDTPGQTTASGTWGTCAWTLDENGTLTIGAGEGARLGDSDDAPWADVADSVKSVRMGGRVVANIVTGGLFKNLENCESIDLTGLDTSGTTYLGWLFAGCTSLKSIDLSPLDTSSATNLNHLFSGCRSLETVDLSPLDTRNVTDLGDMFRECSSLKSIDFTGVDTNRVTYLGDLLYGCTSLSYVDLSPLDTSRVTSMSELFANCSSLITATLTGLDTSRVERFDGMFNGCSSLDFIDFSGLDTSAATTFKDFLIGCNSLRVFDATALDTSSATNLSYMFCGCSSLTRLDLSSFDTSNVTDLSNMFRGAEKLRAIDLSSFDTSRVTNMAEMFFACPEVVSFDLSSFDTSRVDDMHGMFDWCTYTRSIDLSSFDTRAASNMENLLRGCVRLERIDLGPNFSFAGNGATSCALPEEWVNNTTSWYSTAAGAWMSAAEASGRSFTADTYLKGTEVPDIPAPQESSFSDVPNGAWYTKSVDLLAAKGLISGYADTGLFGVGDPLKRDELAAILWRYAEPAESNGAASQEPAHNETGMSDVMDGAWYTSAANWAVKNGVINGFDGVSFAPEEPVTFEQFVTIIANLVAPDAAASTSTAVLDRFDDAASVSSWAAPSMAWAVSEGLVSGYDGKVLAPQESVARERAATVLASAFGLGLL